MEFAFSVYAPKRRKIETAEPQVSIQTNGRIYFNKKAAELLENKSFCMLASDKANKAIGVLPVAAKAANAFPIRYTVKGASIAAKKFFKDTGLLPDGIVKQPPIKSGEYIAVKL